MARIMPNSAQIETKSSKTFVIKKKTKFKQETFGEKSHYRNGNKKLTVLKKTSFIVKNGVSTG